MSRAQFACIGEGHTLVVLDDGRTLDGGLEGICVVDDGWMGVDVCVSAAEHPRDYLRDAQRGGEH